MFRGLRCFTRTQWIKASLAGRFDEASVQVLSSSPRSGSTLLGQVLTAIPRLCFLFEPLQLNHVSEARTAGFAWRTYVDPQANWPQGEAFLRKVFSGRIVNRWTGGQITLADARQAERMLVKFVRANRLLPWLCQTFAIAPPVLLIRHPCAVVASQLKYGWINSRRPETPEFIEQYPEFMSVLEQTDGDDEYLAAMWALDQLPPLLTPHPHPWIIITYEELLLRPEQTIAKIADRWGLEIDMPLALSRLRKPSTTVSKTGIRGINGWKSDLSPEQIERILNVAGKFGLDFYSDDDEADYGALHSDYLADRIHQAGCGERSEMQLRRAA
jgi:hypothetical protein